jgi:methylenetetrahydrofolate dehydrogenase (NADP+)/methenyltetrahydrofolate cyclohydrolase
MPMSDSAHAQLMDGTAVAEQLLAETISRATDFLATYARRPWRAAVLIGDDPASVTYVNMKSARCEQIGIEPRLVALPSSTSTAQAVGVVRELSQDSAVDGILVQHPAPPQVDERAVFEAIAPCKDVDGVTLRSFAAMVLGQPGPQSCTPAGIIRLLDAYGIDPAGKHAVVIGRSPILGMPVGMLLLARNATVTYCHSHTRGLADIVRTGDVLIAAVGKPRFVRGNWLKSGAVVIDAGYNPGNVGDVDQDEARGKADYVTPVPGGVGPMTIAVLLEQTVTAAHAIAAVA